MSFIKYVTDNYVMLYELLGLLIILLISAHIPVLMKKYTRMAIILTLASSMVHVLEAWTQTFETFSGWRAFLTATKYTLYPLILWMLVEIVSIVLRHRSVSTKWKLILLIPEFVGIPLYYTSQWSGLIFKYTLDNIYTSGPLSKLPYVIFAVYLLLFLIENNVLLKNYSARNKIIVIYISLGAILGAVLYLAFTENDDFNPIFTSALAFYYLFVYIYMASIDPLTSLLNRQSYYNDMKIHAKKIAAVVSIDMNDLKYYNDTFGHEQGDVALVSIANILIKEFKYHAGVYRVGGDEFTIFYYDLTEIGVIERIKEMKDELEKTKYRCAFGYAMRRSDLPLDKMISLADSRMYEDKKLIKKKTEEME